MQGLLEFDQQSEWVDEWVVWAGGSMPLNTWNPGHVSPGTLCPPCTAWCLHPPINLICYVHPVKSCRWHRHQWCWRISQPMTWQLKFPSCFDWLHLSASDEREKAVILKKKRRKNESFLKTIPHEMIPFYPKLPSPSVACPLSSFPPPLRLHLFLAFTLWPCGGCGWWNATAFEVGHAGKCL